jgi:hypothetical protein
MDKLEQKLCLYRQLRDTITPELVGNEIIFRYRVKQDDEGIIMPKEVLKEIIRAIPRSETFRYHYNPSAEAPLENNQENKARYNPYTRRGSSAAYQI